MIDEKKLIEEIEILRVPVNGFRGSKILLSEFAVCYKELILRIIEEQPKVGEWIPVSERLPNNMHDVLCCYESKVAEGIHKGESIKYCGVGFYSKFSKEWHGEVELGSNVRVIAWMPLPEPYKGE